MAITQPALSKQIQALEHELGERYTVFDTPWGTRMAILICWDSNLIENVRACALSGAQVLIAPHQTGGTASRSPHGMHPIPMARWDNRYIDPAAIEREFRGPNGRAWLMRWLPARALDNGMFVITSATAWQYARQGTAVVSCRRSARNRQGGCG